MLYFPRIQTYLAFPSKYNEAYYSNKIPKYFKRIKM